MRRSSSDHGRCHVGLVAAEHRPGDASGLVGERDGDEPGGLALQQSCCPDLGRVGLARHSDDSCRAHDEQAADIAVTLCSIRMACSSLVLTATKRMVGRVTASAIAPASAASVLLRLTYGFT